MTARRNKAAWRRSAFTLMELMVSVAILLAVLALIGTIFSTTSKAGGNATAMSILHRQLGQVAEMIEQDLAAMQTSSVMGIQGIVINANETQKSRDLNEPPFLHRSDLLMVFSAREAEPYVFQPNGTAMKNIVQVTYGHADVGRIATSGANIGWIDPATITSIEGNPSPIVAAKWHLARRVVHFVDGPPIGTGAVGGPDITHQDYLIGRLDTVGTEPWSAFASRLPDQALLIYSGPNPAIAYLGPYAIFADGSQFGFGSDGNWWAQSGVGWTRTDPTGTPPITSSPPTVMPINPATIEPWQLWLFYPMNRPIRRTVIDPKPPLGVDRPVGTHFLPNCSEFKVEYTYDDPRELRLDTATGNIDLIPQPIRWHSVPPEGQIIWSNLSVTPTDRTDPRRWPRALRITLRVWDPNGRLTDPVTRTIVHTW